QSKSGYLPVSDSVVAKPSVIVVDTSVYHLISTDAQLINGTYVFTFGANTEGLRHSGDFAQGRVMVGTTGAGYMRKIISIESNEKTITAYTVAAKLEDIFESGSFSINTGSLGDGATGTGAGEMGGLWLTDSVNNLTLHNESGLMVKINSGSFATDANWTYAFHFLGGQLQDYSARSDNRTAISTIDLSVEATTNASVNVTDSYYVKSYYKTIAIGNIPVQVRYDVYLKYRLGGTVPAGTSNRFIGHSLDTFSVHNTYANTNWTNGSNYKSAADVAVTIGGTIGYSNLNVQVGLETIMYLYGIPSAVVYTPLIMEVNSGATANNTSFAVTQQFQHICNEKAYVYGYTLSQLQP
ncbi:MAG: hypothetical protein EBZ77_05290, partial [Chitinophagia bacterium]|nr:hypothetical protein [Chitinophagia bacterium]